MDESLSVTSALRRYGGQRTRTRGRPLKPRPSLPHLNLDLAKYTPPPTPYESVQQLSTSPSTRSLKPPSPAEPGKPSATDDFISAICATLTTFPHTMLFLDTPCILGIRRLNTAHNSFHLSQLSHFPTPPGSDQITTHPEPELRPRRSRLPKSTGSSLFRGRSLRRRKSEKQTHQSDIKTASSDADRPVTAVQPIPFPSDINLSSPNLRPLRAIFPHTDDWWRSVLYAHLVAYNFVRAPITISSTSPPDSFPNNSSAPRCAGPRPSADISVSTARTEIPNQFNTSLKASRTLGMVLPTLPYVSGRELRLEAARDVLEGCVGRIAECMMSEDGPVGGSLEAASPSSRVNSGFVRALAEVVRGCEGLI